MKKVEYCHKKAVYEAGGIMSLVAAVLFVLRACLDFSNMRSNCTLHVFWGMMIVCVCFAIIQIILGIRYKSVAIISESGIGIYGNDKLYCLIPWNSVVKINLLTGTTVKQHIAVVTEDASAQDYQFIHSCSNLTQKTAKKYCLDDVMEKFVRGKITQQQFEKQGIYLLTMNIQQFEKVNHFWLHGRND